MRAISEIFDETRLVVPVSRKSRPTGEIPVSGDCLSVIPLPDPEGSDLKRKLRLPFWLLNNLPTLIREIRRADAVHTPIPGDIGTFGLLIALLFRKPLFVRHCGNWFVRRTIAEFGWRWLLERTAGKRTVVLATGGAATMPSDRNKHVRWIFSTSLREDELKSVASVRSEVPQTGPRLIISARQELAKGTGPLIESLPMLESEFPGISLDVVGDGGALAEFRRLALARGVADRVIFHGKVDHTRVMTLLSKADLFCFPTTSSEGFPKAVLEALACGVPVVTTRVSVLPELVGNGSGLLLDDASPAEIARGIRWCLSDSARYQALSSTAVGTASQYSLERWRDKIAETLTVNWGPLRSLDA